MYMYISHRGSYKLRSFFRFVEITKVSCDAAFAKLCRDPPQFFNMCGIFYPTRPWRKGVYSSLLDEARHGRGEAGERRPSCCYTRWNRISKRRILQVLKFFREDETDLCTFKISGKLGKVYDGWQGQPATVAVDQVCALRISSCCIEIVFE